MLTLRTSPIRRWCLRRGGSVGEFRQFVVADELKGDLEGYVHIKCEALLTRFVTSPVHVLASWAFMRRWIASVVLCLVGWGPLVPMASAFTGNAIPACCRRGGKHHCMMMAGMAASEDGSPRATTKPDPCPYRSQRATSAATPQIHIPRLLVQYIPLASRLTMPALVLRASRRRPSMPQRGPPNNPTNS